MSILSVDNISPIGSGTSVTINSAATLILTNANSTGVVTATSFVGSGANLTGVLSNIVEDTSPQLGGTLDTNNQDITFNGAQNVSWDSSAADLIFNDYAKINLGTDKDFRMYQDTNNTILQSSNTAGGVYLQGALVQIGSETGEAGVKYVKDGAVELYHDNVKALSTSSTGINVWGRSGNGILDIYPTGSAVYSILNLHNTAGGTAYNAQLIATSGQSVYLGSGNTGDVVLRTGNSQNKVVGKHNGATELYHSSNKKFETISTGINVTGGVRIGGNNAANELDDYEEGSWTVGIDSRTVSGSEGHYTKIGRLVVCQFNLNGLNASTSPANISGIPFASKNTNQIGVCLINDVSGVSYSSGSSDIYGRVNANATNVQLLSKKTDGSSHSSTTFTLQTNVVLRGYIWYMTA